MKLHARVIILVAACVFALPLTLLAQDTSSGKDKPLAFRTAIELALKNSATTGLSQADLVACAVRSAADEGRVSAADGGWLRAGRIVWLSVEP